MKNNIGRLLLASALSWVLVGCAFGKDSASNNQKEVEDRIALKQTYDTIRGTYAGTLKTADSEYPVQISLFPDEEKAGTNSDGEIIYRPILRATYKRLDIVVPDAVMDARYIKVTSELILSNPAAANPDDIRTINAVLSGQVLKGTVNTKKGELGTIDLSLVSRTTPAPSQGDQNKINDELKNLYESIAGTYEGDVIPDPTVAAPFTIQIRLFVVSNKGVPVLSGYYSRLDDNGGSLDQSLDVVYKPETKPAQIEIRGGAAGGRSGSYFVAIEGFVTPGQIEASFSTQKGYLGNVILIKK